MSKLNKIDNYSTIIENGKITHVLVPLEEFLAYCEEKAYTYVPKQVGDAVLDGVSPLRAWREFKKLTQAEMGCRMSISREAYQQMEAASRPRKATLTLAAEALGIDKEQLVELY
jgi:DNA-binding XRE family transcriptional regulator